MPIIIGNDTDTNAVVLEFNSGSGLYVLKEVIPAARATGGNGTAQFGLWVDFIMDFNVFGQQPMIGTSSNAIHRFIWDGVSTFDYFESIETAAVVGDPFFGSYFIIAAGSDVLCYAGKATAGDPNGSGAVLHFEKGATFNDPLTLTKTTKSDTFTGGVAPIVNGEFARNAISFDPRQITGTDGGTTCFGFPKEGSEGEIYESNGYLAAPDPAWKIIPSPLTANAADTGGSLWGKAVIMEVKEDPVTPGAFFRYIIGFAPDTEDGGIRQIGKGALFENTAGTYTLVTDTADIQHFRYFYSFLDNKLNLINSDFTQRTFTGTAFSMPIPSMYSTPFEEFSPLFVDGDGTSVGEARKSDGTTVISYTATNAEIDDFLYVITVTDEFNISTVAYEPVKVVAKDAGAMTITIDLSLLRDKSFIPSTIFKVDGTGEVYDKSLGNTRLLLFTSLDEFFNYQLVQLGASEANNFGFVYPTTTVTLTKDELDNLTIEDFFMDDIYDTTIRKVEIPKIKFLTSYQNHLIGGNVDFPDEVPRIGFRNQVIWSDFSIGGSLESFAPFDFVEIGVNNSREITGVFGAQDSVVMFKSNRIYFLNGTLIAGEFRVRESLSEGIGAVAHNAVIEVEDGALFMSDRGIYHVYGGNKPTEISDVNQALFINPEIILTDTVAVLDPINERMLVYLQGSGGTASRILFYDYYFKQWFLLEDVPMSGPLAFFNREIYIANDDTVRKPGSDFTDELSPATFQNVTASYSTGWMDLEVASLRKKFVNLVVFSLNRVRDFPGSGSVPNYTLNVTTQVDWVNTVKEKFTMEFTDEVRADDHKLAITQNRSLRFIFENSDNVNMLMTGYQFEWQATQSKPKMVR